MSFKNKESVFMIEDVGQLTKGQAGIIESLCWKGVYTLNIDNQYRCTMSAVAMKRLNKRNFMKYVNLWCTQEMEKQRQLASAIEHGEVEVKIKNGRTAKLFAENESNQ